MSVHHGFAEYTKHSGYYFGLFIGIFSSLIIKYEKKCHHSSMEILYKTKILLKKFIISLQKNSNKNNLKKSKSIFQKIDCISREDCTPLIFCSVMQGIGA